VVDVKSELSNTMPPLEVFEREARRLGIDIDSQIVVYDDFGNFCASRVWFMFKSMGHNNIQVLAGGLAAWLEAGLDTQKNLLTPKVEGNFIAHPNAKYQFIDKDFILNHVVNVEKPDFPLVDARSAERFKGETAEQKPGLRSGHISNSVNIHYQRLQDENGAFIPLTEITSIFESVIAKSSMSESAMAFTCGSGVTACILAQAADSLGMSPLYVYDGSWSEWGKHAHLPISTGQ
jgi:thiosulfate/3-mercaptopyruvate sulfurtransferase